MTRYSRRQFVSTLTAGAVSMPFVSALLRGRAIAAPGDVPVRFLAVRTFHGTDRHFFIPRDLSGNEPASIDMALSELTFEYDNAFLRPLQDWRDRITVLDGLDQWVTQDIAPGKHGHAEQAVGLTGSGCTADGVVTAGHPSIDFFLHNNSTAPVLLTAGCAGQGDSSPGRSVSFNDTGSYRVSTDDPDDLFREAFPADFLPPDPGSFVDYSAAERRVYERSLSSLDVLRQELTGEEKIKLDRHAEAMDRLLSNVNTRQPALCGTSGNDPAPEGGDNSVAGLEITARGHTEVIAQAFACDRSRAATLRIGSGFHADFKQLPEVQALNMSSLGGAFAGDWDYHNDLVHGYWQNLGNPLMEEAYSLGQQWGAQRFAEILSILDAMPDPLDPSGTSTTLDNTIVYWHNEFGHGPHDRQAANIPAVIAGGAGGALRLGRYLRLREWDSDTRVPHNRLLTSFCHASGLSEVGFFGDNQLRNDPTAFGRYHGELTEVMT